MNHIHRGLVGKYRQAILDHINEHPEHFADGPEDGTTASEDATVRRTVPYVVTRFNGPPPQPAREPRPTGIELQWHDVVEPAYHAALRITPTNQDYYKDDPRFSQRDEFGRRYATLGAGPDPGNFWGMFLHGKLKSNYNRTRDVRRHGPGTMIEPLSGMTEDQFINRLFKIDREYNDDLDYGVVTHGPYVNRARQLVSPAYDSNSYISGLLQAAGVQPPDLPVWAPGYTNRLKPKYFGE